MRQAWIYGSLADRYTQQLGPSRGHRRARGGDCRTRTTASEAELAVLIAEANRRLRPGQEVLDLVGGSMSTRLEARASCPIRWGRFGSALTLGRARSAGRGVKRRSAIGARDLPGGAARPRSHHKVKGRQPGHCGAYQVELHRSGPHFQSALSLARHCLCHLRQGHTIRGPTHRRRMIFVHWGAERRRLWRLEGQGSAQCPEQEPPGPEALPKPFSMPRCSRHLASCECGEFLGHLRRRRLNP